jgi:photosystem II stability/assembly factor-like uncharacterized protein
MRHVLAACAVLACGCTAWFGDRDRPADLAVGDLAGADFAGADFAGVDLSADFAMPPPPDLAGSDFAGIVVWSRPTSPVTTTLQAVWGCAGGDVYAVGAAGVALHLETGTWTPTTGLPNVSFNAVGGNDCGDIYTAGQAGDIYYSTGNNVWASRKSHVTVTLAGLWANATSETAVGTAGTITRGNTPAVMNFNAVATTVNNDLRAIAGAGSTVFAMLDDGRVIKSIDGGATWPTAPTGLTLNNMRGLWVSSDAQTIFVAGAAGVIAKSTDGGANFAPLTVPPAPMLNGLWGSSTSDVYAVGDAGTILHTIDGGASWKYETGGVTSNLNGVWGSAANDVWAVGDAGVILHRP